MQTHKESRAGVLTLTEGVIWKQLLLFFFPILLGSFFQQFYNTVDAVIVGRMVGKYALAAVGGSAAMIINLLVGFFVGLASGTTVVVAQHRGAGDQEKVSNAVHTSAALGLAGGVLMTLLCVFGSGPILRLLQTPPEIMGQSVSYMRIYSAGMLFSLLYNIGAGILRAVGDSRRPLYYLIAACGVNIVLDLLLVGALGMGVNGAAWATVFSQLVSCMLTVLTLLRSRDSYRLCIRKIRFHREMLWPIIRIGLPAGLQSVMFNGSNLVIQGSINRFGTDTVAAWSVYGKIDGIYWMTMNAFSVALTSFVGQNFGAGKLERIKRSVGICMAFACCFALVLTAVLLLWGRVVLLLFTDDTAVMDIAMQMMRVVVPAYVLWPLIEVFSGTARGCGDVKIPTVMMLLGVCALRVVWVYVVLPLRPELSTLTFCYPLTWFVTGCAFTVYYFLGRWQTGGHGRLEPLGKTAKNE